MASVFGAAAPLAATLPYRGLVVFGDSLSDTGNAGRFSNGPVWVEYLARAMGVSLAPVRDGGTNFAVGGARAQGGAFSLRDQANLFLARLPGRINDERTLVIVYGGANDLRGAYHASDRMAVVDGASAALRSIVTDLIDAGATDLLVPNVPDIGRTPEAQALGPDWVRAARALTLAFNERLASLLDEVEAQGSVQIHRLDLFGLAESATKDPARFGFRNMSDPCHEANTVPERCNDYVFWDSLHPTTAAHARMAEVALAVLADGVSP